MAFVITRSRRTAWYKLGITAAHSVIVTHAAGLVFGVQRCDYTDDISEQNCKRSCSASRDSCVCARPNENTPVMLRSCERRTVMFYVDGRRRRCAYIIAVSLSIMSGCKTRCLLPREETMKGEKCVIIYERGKYFIVSQCARPGPTRPVILISGVVCDLCVVLLSLLTFGRA